MIAFSTFLEIHVLRNWFDESDPTEAFQQKLRFFMVTLCASSVFAFLGCKITDRTEKNEHEIEHFSSFNASPLLSGGSAVLGSSSPKAAIPTDDLEYVQLADQMSASSVTYQQQITRFLTDPLMYPLNAAFFMAVGATEFFLTNLSSILSSLGQDTLDYDLQLYSVTSTVIRFVIMVATDHVCATYGISRLSILAGLIVMCGLGHVYLSSWPIPGLHVNVVVMLNALLNSGIYTLFPAVLAAVYGFEVLGTTYGIFSCCSIIGNMLLNLVYGADYTRNCVDSANNNLVICSTYTFLLSGVALTVLGSLIYSLKNRYLARVDEDF
ncbi:hypothetical protein KL923_000322 [Ogataea haglerorum]|nr:hypothetical protein KL923_000322 [Ogataea haglerorum]